MKDRSSDGKFSTSKLKDARRDKIPEESHYSRREKVFNTSDPSQINRKDKEIEMSHEKTCLFIQLLHKTFLMVKCLIRRILVNPQFHSMFKIYMDITLYLS